MTPQAIERRLQTHILTLCLATAAGKEGDIRQAKEFLLAEVGKMVREAGGKPR